MISGSLMFFYSKDATQQMGILGVDTSQVVSAPYLLNRMTQMFTLCNQSADENNKLSCDSLRVLQTYPKKVEFLFVVVTIRANVLV